MPKSNQSADEEVRELRLRYTVDGMTTVINLIDHMKLGKLAEPLALFLAHASDAANWHASE